MCKRRAFLGILFFVFVTSALCFLVSCVRPGNSSYSGDSGAVSKKELRVAALKGPTAMGLVYLMDRVENAQVDSCDYKFTVSSSVDEIIPKISNNEVDIAMIPANLSSVLYNSMNGGVRVIAVNTLGVLYIIGRNDSVKTVADLKGRTIYASGKGATPEYALNYILKNNGLDPTNDVNIEWKSEHSECLASFLMSGEDSVAMLPQPFVASAKAKNDKITTVVDLNSEWDKIQRKSGSDSALVTGVAVVSRDFSENNRVDVERFLDYYKESVDFVNKNVQQAAELVEKYGIVTSDVAVSALPECNISFIEGESMKSALSGYLGVLFGQNPKSVGGKLPDDDFYFKR